MRVWLVTIGEPLPTDHGTERLHRAGILAETLAAAGHEVLWWTSTFNHSTKTLRSDRSERVRLAPNYTIRMLHGGGYARNISVARLRDHRRIAREFTREAASEPRPDVIVASLPALELSHAAVRYARAVGVPAVVDVRDLWPDIFADALPGPLRPLAPVALAPLQRLAREACRGATALWGPTREFVSWGLAHAGRPGGPFDVDFPFGYATDEPSQADLATASAMWAELGVRPGDPGITACFMGAIGHQTDVAGIVTAARTLTGTPGIRFVLCGAGDRLDELRASAAGLDNILFAGWRRRAEIWSLLRMAHVGIAPYRNIPNFIGNLPNKVPEYLSGGLAIALNLSRGVVFDLLAAHGCGFSYHDDPAELARWMVALRDDPVELARMRANAIALFENRFRADRVYGGMVALLEQIVGAQRAAPSIRAG